MSLISGFEHFTCENQPLGSLTGLAFGTAADYFAEPTTVDELAGIVKRFTENDLPVRILGAGSNLLIRDEKVGGLVVQLSAPAFTAIEVDGSKIKLGGGSRLSHFVASAVREGMSGPHHLVGLPGTIGGALHSDQDFPNVDVRTWVRSVEALKRDGETVTHGGQGDPFSHYQSSLQGQVILSVEMEFEKEEAADLTKRMQKLWIVRRAKRPPPDVNAAYIFKNHGGESASELIDAAGLKGTSVGSVSLFDTDPNYLVAEAGATAQQAVELIEKVSAEVEQKLDVKLERAIQIW